ncbi:hypothetical protein XENTR_v10023154 [Xenopus tropicalis]|nr:hypothetical protein XENTR_v10023154 [Xenopus tropicalis]
MSPPPPPTTHFHTMSPPPPPPPPVLASPPCHPPAIRSPTVSLLLVSLPCRHCRQIPPRYSLPHHVTAATPPPCQPRPLLTPPEFSLPGLHVTSLSPVGCAPVCAHAPPTVPIRHVLAGALHYGNLLYPAQPFFSVFGF